MPSSPCIRGLLCRICSILLLLLGKTYGLHQIKFDTVMRLTIMLQYLCGTMESPQMGKSNTPCSSIGLVLFCCVRATQFLLQFFVVAAAVVVLVDGDVGSTTFDRYHAHISDKFTANFFSRNISEIL